MKNINRFSLSLVALLIVSGLAMAPPASARDGSQSTTTTTASSSGDSAADNTSNETVTKNGTTLAEQFREQAQQRLKTERQSLKAKTEAEREKACDARKDSLSKRMANAVALANKHMTVIDTAYSRVKAFHDSKNLSVPDYTSLTGAVDAAQAKAKTQIAALQSLNVSIDCTSQTAATGVSAFQQAIRVTRDSLKAYRSSLVKLIDSLRGASTGAHSEGNSLNNGTAQQE